ncbi:Cadherin EGF LAG seven-pass G-type receptor 1 [Folsomia candida]|uniref:Cadherin EGF LAG seven-pass G-type receptor 1 n=1 Tax=Folsomia candida TaxID=158441 RepID=A0A226EJP4_FOLCA|nr:Cadherin EGF LAG seven-pass G-type receptor 1 [Folsomia candida]
MFRVCSLFSDLRSVAGTTLMNLLASLFLTQLLYVVGAGGVQAADLCVSLALALHYSRLTVVSWLLAATHDLYRTVKSQVGMIDCPPPSLLSSFLKYSLLGWGLPALLLACAVFIQDYDGIGESGATQLRRHNCWFTSNRSFFTAFVLPYWIILAVTIYYIVRGAMAIRWAAAFAPSKKAQEKLTRRRKLQLMLFVRILVFLTLIIMAGAASVIFGSNLAFIVYSCGQAIQGILIALAVCCNCQILKLYTRSIQVAGQQVATAMTTYGSSGQELSKSASLQLLTWDRNPDSV